MSAKHEVLELGQRHPDISCHAMMLRDGHVAVTMVIRKNALHQTEEVLKIVGDDLLKVLRHEKCGGFSTVNEVKF